MKNNLRTSLGRLKFNLDGISKFLLILIAAILILLILIFAFLNKSSNELFKSTAALSQTQQSNLADQLNDLYNNILRLCHTLSSNEHLVAYATHSEETPSELLAQDGFELQKDLLSTINIYGDRIHTIAVYFPTSKSVVTMARQLSSDSIHLFFNDYPDILPQDLQHIFSNSFQNTEFIYSKQSNWVIYRTHHQDNTAYILIEYDIQGLIDYLIKANSNTVVFINRINTCIYSNVATPNNETFHRIVLNSKYDNYFELDGKVYDSQFRDNHFQDLDIIVGTPKNQLIITQDLLTVLFVITSALFLVFLFTLTRNLRNNVLAPIDSIAANRDYNEKDYRSILHAISNDFATVEHSNEQLQSEKNLLSSLALGKLLSRIIESHGDSDEQIESYANSCLLLAGIPSGHPFATFSLICTADEDHIFSGNVPAALGGISSLHYFLNNVLTDLLFKDNAGTIVSLGKNNFIVIVDSLEASQKIIEDACSKLISFYETHFSVFLSVSTIYFGESPASFATNVSKLNDETSFLQFWGSNSHIEAPITGSSDFLSCCNTIRRYISNISAQNYNTTIESLESVLKQAVPKNGKNIEIVKYRLYAVTSFITAAIEEKLGTEYLMQNQELESRLYSIDNMADYRIALGQILNEIVGYDADSDESQSGGNRMEDVRQYLVEHYTENTLNVASVAEYFGISVSYLSRSFKKAYNVNLLEYIQRMRVESAKKLLPTNSVQSVAQTVGFWDSQGLMRAFKKYVGISPGDYKRIAEKAE